MKRKLIAGGAATLLAAGLVIAGATSASAVSVSDYCLDHLQTHTEQATVLPNKALNCQMQAGPARAYGYTGPINGTLGKNSWKGIQAYLRANWRYQGSLSGVPGHLTYTAMQRAANTSGYLSKPVSVDGTLELKDWQGWAYRVRVNFFTD